MNTKIRVLRMRGRLVGAAGIMLLMAAALGVTEIRAEETMVAYAPSTNRATHQAKVDLGAAMSSAAKKANAALTRDIRLRLDDAVQIRSMVASTQATRRG